MSDSIRRNKHRLIGLLLGDGRVMVAGINRYLTDAAIGTSHPRSTHSPTIGVRSRSGRPFARSTLLHSTLLRNIARGSYLKFFGVQHIVGFHVLGFVESALTVIDGEVVLAAAWKGLAGIVRGWLEDGVRLARCILNDGYSGNEVHKPSGAQFLADGVVDELLMIGAVGVPQLLRLVVLAG